MRQRLLALALFLSFVPAAHAGSLHARIESTDGSSYTARTLACNENDFLEPWAYAEGVVDGMHQSVLIRLTPTSEHGVYRFARTWPTEGLWMIRLSLGHWPAPATVALLNSDGTVKSNKLYKKSDGSGECWKVLSKAPGVKSDQGC